MQSNKNRHSCLPSAHSLLSEREPVSWYSGVADDFYQLLAASQIFPLPPSPKHICQNISCLLHSAFQVNLKKTKHFTCTFGVIKITLHFSKPSLVPKQELSHNTLCQHNSKFVTKRQLAICRFRSITCNLETCKTKTLTCDNKSDTLLAIRLAAWLLFRV